MKAVETIYPDEEKLVEEFQTNPTYEKKLQLLEDIIELGNNSDDYVKLHYLNYKLYKEPFDSIDISIFNDLKNKYLMF